MSSEVITITEQPVELCKLLKIANMVSGGGEAKIVISEGYVSLNGEVEYRKRKKVVDGDIVEFNGQILQVKFDSSTSFDNKADKSATQITESKKKTRTKNKEKETQIDAPVKSKRKPISF